MNTSNFEEIISLENILEAWREFIVGKKSRRDVQMFELNLMSNIIGLHQDIVTKRYKHSAYESFNISDPKPRNIHKATVRDRLLHHAIYRILYPFFDRKFISDSYSCRIGKGTHKAIDKFQSYYLKASKNKTKTVWVLKCDIRKFFASIDHKTLKKILEKHIKDKNILWLLSQIIDSFSSIYAMAEIRKGLPLGNLTSQLLVNIYMNEFDQFAKHKLKTKYYIRYADDFAVMSPDKSQLKEILTQIKFFLKNYLLLDLHPNKVSITTLASGIDFLGWVHFPAHRVLRTTTKRRMLKNLKNNLKLATVQSYFGMLSHGNGIGLENIIKKQLPYIF